MPLTTKLSGILMPKRSITSFNDVNLVVVDRDKCRIGRSTFYSISPAFTTNEVTINDVLVLIKCFILFIRYSLGVDLNVVYSLVRLSYVGIYEVRLVFVRVFLYMPFYMWTHLQISVETVLNGKEQQV